MHGYQPGKFTDFNNNLMKKLRLFWFFVNYKNSGKSPKRPAIKLKGI